jgi:hypothetical protein
MDAIAAGDDRIEVLDGDRTAAARLRQSSRTKGAGDRRAISAIFGIAAPIAAPIAASAAEPDAGRAARTARTGAASGDHPDAVRSLASGFDTTVIFDPHTAGSAALTLAAGATITANPIAARTADAIGSIWRIALNTYACGTIDISVCAGRRRSGGRAGLPSATPDEVRG